MDYQDRKRVIARWLADFLSSFERPPHLAEANLEAKEMKALVEDINSEIRSKIKENVLNAYLEKVAQHIRKNQTSRRWPSSNMFMKALKEYRSFTIDDELGPATEITMLDAERINAKRIKEKQNVSEFWVTGKGGRDLLEKGLVTPTDLAPYEKWLLSQKKQLGYIQ